MKREQQIDIILKELDGVITIPTYQETQARECLGKAFTLIEKQAAGDGEKQFRDSPWRIERILNLLNQAGPEEQDKIYFLIMGMQGKAF